MTNPLPELVKLSVAERIQLVEDIWDSIAAEADAVPLSDELREELDDRLEDQAANPGVGEPWAQVKARLLEPASPHDEVSPMHLQIEVEREEDGRWIAEVPELPGVMAYGEDRASAVARAQALALRLLAERMEQQGKQYLEERARRGSREKYEASLAEVPDVEPEAYDRLKAAATLLDPAEGRALAEEGLAADLEAWPEY